MTKRDPLDGIPQTMRIPDGARERVRAIWEASNARPELRPTPQEIIKTALEIGLSSAKLAPR
jgi:hypothetical protein